MLRKRKTLRLKGYDYSTEGSYFVTICVKDRECLLGNVVDSLVILSNVGRIIKTAWGRLPNRFPNIGLEEFVIMPNHVHGIVTIVGAPFMAPDERGRGTVAIPSGMMDQKGATRLASAQKRVNRAPTLGEIVRTFKALTTHKIHLAGITRFRWQHNYFERIICDEQELFEVRQYIEQNPLKWDLDPENPFCKRT